MPRKALIRSKEFPYHVTARSNNREPFVCDLRYAWRVLIQQLADAEEGSHVKVHAFVLMPNHFHLILSTPGDDLGIVMQNFMRSVTKIMNSKTGRSGRVFGGVYHWSLIDTMDYFDCAMKYVYRNPVKARLSHSVEWYEFSTLPFVTEGKSLDIQLHPPIGENHLIPNQDRKGYLEWLNTPFLVEQDEDIRISLRKTRFLPFQIMRRRPAKVDLPTMYR